MFVSSVISTFNERAVAFIIFNGELAIFLLHIYDDDIAGFFSSKCIRSLLFFPLLLLLLLLLLCLHVVLTLATSSPIISSVSFFLLIDALFNVSSLSLVTKSLTLLNFKSSLKCAYNGLIIFNTSNH